MTLKEYLLRGIVGIVQIFGKLNAVFPLQAPSSFWIQSCKVVDTELFDDLMGSSVPPKQVL